MEEENKTMNEETKTPLEQLEEMKQNMISKDEYNRVLGERNLYFKQITEGTPKPKEEKPKADIGELRKKFLFGDLSNINYWEDALDLRQAIIDEGGKDPFLPYGHGLEPSDDDIMKANRVADVVGQCIEIADGDSGIFTAALQSRLNDTTPIKRR